MSDKTPAGLEGVHLRPPGAGFLESRMEWAGAGAALAGVPLDVTTSFWAGTRFAPGRVREVSYDVEPYSPDLDRDLSEVHFVDTGDLELAHGNVDAALAEIERGVGRLAATGLKPVLIGGEHLLTYPAVRAVHKLHPELVVVQFDAHTDLREAYLGSAHSHATVIRKIVDLLGRGRVYQFGIRSGVREEFAFARTNTHLVRDRVLEPLRAVLGELGGRPIYLTIDIDVCDPAYAPGTGTPEPGGISSRELLDAVQAMRGLDIVACDVVEYSPPAEHGVQTAVLVAKVLRELLLTIL